MNTVQSRLAMLIVTLPLVGAWATQGSTGAAGADAAKPEPKPAPVVVTQSVKPLPLPAPTEVEQQYGIQIVHVALTASGGLVDARFKVLDAAKAKTLLGNAANAPVLIAGDKPPLMAPHHALRGARFSNGQVFYILYPNTRSAIRSGVEVVVAMGAARLGPVTAQ